MRVAHALLLLILGAIAFVAVVIARAGRSEAMFDELVQDFPVGDEADFSLPPDGSKPSGIAYALDDAFGVASTIVRNEGVALAVVRRDELAGTFMLGILNRTDRSMFIPTAGGIANSTAELLNLQSGEWEDCSVGRCGTGEVHRLVEVESRGLFEFDAPVAIPHDVVRTWIRFRVLVQRSDGRFPSPFTVVSNPVRTKGG